MTNIFNPNTPISYINKDFQTLYIELLDTVKKLTSTWDPSISNESDPGVILLKLDALIADKLNYNLDMNMLEAFPNTVSQYSNAYNLFDQLGYLPDWYISATSNNAITLTWNNTKSTADDNVIPDGETRTVPKFTMICDKDRKNVYTLLSEVIFTSGLQENKVSAIEGIISKLEVNGDDIITLSNLDTNNRIYLPAYNVAQNGVYISNVDIDGNTLYNFNDWVQKDNLYIETLGQKIYKFGVDQNQNIPYIEFTSDIDLLIENGIRIYYILSNGISGNISAKVLNDFYSETKYKEDIDTIISTSDITITNTSAIVNGKDPETIDSSYRNYKKVSGTFETLVTLRDYINALYNSGYVSNDFVCDRTNDIQHSYDIIVDQNGLDIDHLVIDEVNGAPMLDAFDLKLYALQNIDNITDTADYYNTFNIVAPNNISANTILQGALEANKCIQHNYGSIVEDKFCMFRNEYPLNIKIIPFTKLTTTQAENLQDTIISALIEALNARNVDFGEETTYDLVYDIIQNCDNRIKSVVLDNFSYTTYAVYWNGTYFIKVPLNNEAGAKEKENPTDFRHVVAEPLDWDTNFTDYYFKQETTNIDGSTEVSYINTAGAPKIDVNKFYCRLTATTTWEAYCCYRLDIDSWILLEENPENTSEPFYKATLAADGGGEVADSADYAVNYQLYSFSNNSFPKNPSSGTSYPKTLPIIQTTQGEFNSDTVYTPRILSYQKEIYAKSVLAGKTELLEKDTDFNYSLIEKTSENELKNITIISSLLSKKVFDHTPNTESTIKLGSNQNVIFYAPKFNEKISYSSYIKYELHLGNNNTIPANTPYKFGENDYITFFYKQEDSDTRYTAVSYGQGTILESSFAIRTSPTTQSGTQPKDVSGADISAASLTEAARFNISTLSSTAQQKMISDETLNNMLYIVGVGVDSKNNFITSGSPEAATLKAIFKTWADQILSGQREINILEEDSTTYNYNSDIYCYWITLDATNPGTLTLDSSGSYILKDGEFFILTDSYQKNLDILQSGYQITFNGSGYANAKINCTADVSIESINLFGAVALTSSNRLVKLSNILKNQNDSVTFTNSDIYTIPDNSEIVFNLALKNSSLTFNSIAEANLIMEKLNSKPDGWEDNYKYYFTSDDNLQFNINSTSTWNNVKDKIYNLKLYIKSETSVQTQHQVLPEGISISYKQLDTTTFTDLPNLISPYRWRFYSRLNIDTSNKTAQQLAIKDLTDDINEDGTELNLDTLYTIIFNDNTGKKYYYIPGFIQIDTFDSTAGCWVLDVPNITLIYYPIGSTAPGSDDNYAYFKRTTSTNTEYIKSNATINTLGAYNIQISTGEDGDMINFKVYSDNESVTKANSNNIKVSDDSVNILINSNDILAANTGGNIHLKEVTLADNIQDFTNYFIKSSNLYIRNINNISPASGASLYQETAETDGVVNVVLFSKSSEASYTITVDFDLGLPIGSYLLPISCDSENTKISCNLKTKIDSADSTIPLYLISDSHQTPFKLNSINHVGYIYIETNEKYSESKLEFTVTSTDKTDTPLQITLKPLIKFNAQNTNYLTYISTLKELDKDGIYNYSYVTDADTEITNPLDGASFFNTNHIFNSFTIPVGLIDKSTITIIDKIKDN